VFKNGVQLTQLHRDKTLQLSNHNCIKS